MGLRDIGATLPPGFKFFPSDEELVCHYLYKKIENEQTLKGTLVEIDLHVCEPWELPEVAKLNANEWYFFSFRDRKYATGFRTNRATTCGYWKATGKDRTVMNPTTKEVVGMRKTLVFYRNRAPNGIKTGWIMHEFRLETPHMLPKVDLLITHASLIPCGEDWVLCRVFQKNKSSYQEPNYTNNYKLNQQIIYDNITQPNPISNYHNTIPYIFNTQTQTQTNITQSLTSTTPLTQDNPNQDQNPNPAPSTSMLTLDFSPHHQNNINYSTTFDNNNKTHITEITSKPPCACNDVDDVDDAYSFLWDMHMNYEECSLGDHAGVVGPETSNLEGIRFEIDNSIVFL